MSRDLLAHVADGNGDDDNEVDTLENMANFVVDNNDDYIRLHHDVVHSVQKVLLPDHLENGFPQHLESLQLKTWSRPSVTWT